MRIFILFFLFLSEAFFCVFPVDAQDVVLLKNGKEIQGKILSRNKTSVVINPGVGTGVTYYSDEIDTIDGQRLQTAISSVNQPQSQPQPSASYTNTTPEALKSVNSENEDIRQAQDLIKKEDYPSALLILNRLVENGSNNFWVYVYRASCLDNNKDYDGAINGYFDAIKLDSEKGKQLYKELGYVYLEKRNGAQADNWFREHLRYFPNDAESYYGLAIAGYVEHVYTTALDNFNTAQRLGYHQDPEGLREKIREAQDQADQIQQAKEYNTQQRSHSSSSSNSNKDIGYAFYGLIFGIYSFFHGFVSFRKKRLIQDIPTSTVRSLAMGLVELNGKVKKTKTLVSPLTATECSFYRYTIERYESNGRSGMWVIIGKGDSSSCPFCLDDGTGQIMILPKEAEWVMPVDYQFQTGLGKKLPDNLVGFMEKNSLKYKALIGDYSLRFYEWYLKPDESVFVLGTAQQNSPQLYGPRETLSNSLDEVKTSGNDAADVIIAKGEKGQVFIVSDESQTQVVKSLSWQAFSGIWGGSALTLAALAYLLFRFGLWSRF